MKKLLLAGALLCSAGLASALLLPVGNEIVLTTQEATQENLLPVSGFDDADFSQTFTSGVFNQWTVHKAADESSAVNIALMCDNKPVFGVIYVPYKEVIYFSDDERGAFRSRSILADPAASHTYEQLFEGAEPLPLQASCNQPLRIAVSRSHRNAETERLVANILSRYPDAEIIEQGSSYKLCLLAEGSIDFYPRTTDTYEWDTAAGEAILRKAGGIICRADDRTDLQYNKESLVNPHFVCRSKGLLER